MMTFEERAAWILNKIKERVNITNVQLSKILGVDKNTVQAYCHGNGMIKGAALAAIVKTYGVNGEWLLSGSGEPFPGAREKFPEVCGPPGVTAEQYAHIVATVRESQEHPETNAPPADPAPQRDFSIAEDVTLAIKVLESKTHYATALHLNIRSFAGAVDDKNALSQVMRRLEIMERKLDALQSENKGLKEEIKELKEAGGGCAPINLSPVNAAPTGTVNQES